MSGEQTLPTAHWMHRHTWPIRVMHWINVLALTLLLMSGLQIFNAHPALYWGKSSYTGKPAILEMTAREKADGSVLGVTRIFGREFNTTGVLGASRNERGEMAGRGFPSWATIPSTQWLAMARRWHLFFAWLFVVNGVAYVVYSIASRHLSRDLAPSRRDWRGIGASFRDHILLRHPTGDAATRYNVLQKLSYLIVIFGLLPLTILMGWALSPWLDSALTGWIDVFGGRQSARTIHFIAAWALVAFVLVHVFEVVISGFWNNLRSMITGRYRIDAEAGRETKI